MLRDSSIKRLGRRYVGVMLENQMFKGFDRPEDMVKSFVDDMVEGIRNMMDEPLFNIDIAKSKSHNNVDYPSGYARNLEYQETQFTVHLN